MLIRLKSSSLVLTVIGSMSMHVQPFYERLANNGKITTFTRVPLFDALDPAQVSLNLENRDLDR